jgi:hypothetical protein
VHLNGSLGMGLEVDLGVGLEVGFLIVVICACDVAGFCVRLLCAIMAESFGGTYRICRRTGTALLQKTLRTESEANDSSARSRISFISSYSARLSGTRSITASATAAWKAWKLPRPLVYHLYGLN